MLATESGAVDRSVSEKRSLDLTWKQIVQPAEPFLQAVAHDLTEQIHAFDSAISTYAEYALSVQGKQLRPVLVALSGGATGRVEAAHVSVAVIIEMVHLATLVHDDVMDEAELRRGRPTLAAKWGNDISVLLGDCLFAHALRLAASFPTPEICREVAQATNTVCSGEILQTQRRRQADLSRVDYFKILRMKTGELFALSCSLGALLSGAERSQRESLRQYGLSVGTAYQIYDDCVDLFGSEMVAGKSLGTDLAKGKLTLPIILVAEQAKVEERRKLVSLVEHWEPGCVTEVRKLLRRYDALEGSRMAVEGCLDEARQALSDLAASESKNSLLGLVEYLRRQAASLRDVG